MATPSLAMVPSGYKDGKLYSVLPNNAGGDFDVTRGSLATRVNKDGLIEPVGTLGADVVLNGDFEEVGADQILNGDFSQEGSDVIVNGDFATDSDWDITNNIGSTTNISGGSLNIVTDGANTQAKQINILTSGKSYAVNYTVTSSSGVGSLAIVKGASAVVIPKNVGTHTFYFEAESAVFAFKRGGGALNVSIDNVSVVEVGQEWVLGDGWSIGEDKAISNNSGSGSRNLRQNNIATIGKTYKITLDADITSGFPYLVFGGTADIVSGTNTFYKVATSTDIQIRNSSNNFVGSISNITVEEVGQEWVLSDGCSITAQGARITSDGTYQVITQNNALVIGDTYEVEYEITEYVSGVISAEGSFAGIYLKTTVGVHKFYSVAGSSALTIKRAGACDVTIDNIKVKRLNGDDTPRIDYTDGGCPVLLTEPQSTNLVANSSEMSEYDSNVTVIDNSTVSPNGDIDASKVTKNGVSANDRIDITNVALLNGSDFNVSAFIKNDDIAIGGVTTLGVRISGGSLFRQGYEWNGDTPSLTIDYGSGTRTNVLLEDYGNGWWRIGYSFNSDGTNSDIEIDIDRSNGTDTTSVFLWGAQVEELSYATSLIPTYGAVRTRLQDTVTGAGTSSDINSTEGVLFAEISGFDSQINDTFSISLSDGSSANRIFISINSLNNVYRGFAASSLGSSDVNFTVTDTSSVSKVAVRYSPTDFSLWVNGIKRGVGVYNGMSNALNELSFDRDGNGELPFFGKTSQVQVFKTALTDAELQTLTTI